MKLTKKQKLIQEFFDFYSINELYLRCGGFRDIGYATYPVFVSARAEEKIKEKYEKTVNAFHDKVYNALVKSVKSELRHFGSKAYSPDGYLSGTTGLYCFFEKEHGLTHEMITCARENPEIYPEIAHLLFNEVRWAVDYGGASWANGTRALIDSKLVKSIEDKVFWVDRVLDLYHNNGHMLDKTDFEALSEDHIDVDDMLESPLNFRAATRSIMKFIPFNSNPVIKLVMPQKNKLTFK